jgi:two-component sensor histidine kinase
MTRRTKVALRIFLYACAVVLLEFSYHYLDFVTRQDPTPWQIPFLEQLTGVFAAVTVIPVAIWLVRRYPLNSARNALIHLAALLCGSAAHTTLNWGLRLLLFPLAGLGHYDYGAMPMRYFMELPSDVILYGLALSLTTLYDRQLRSAHLEKTLAQAQLRNLRLQLNPHFLFNTLNTISAVMYEDVRIADRMIARLSDLLRSTLERGDAQEVTLEREIEFLRLYVETMKARFEERLQVDVETGEETLGAMVPPLLLQPLVENSIKHGADAETSKVRIQVRAARQNGSLLLEVRDHGPGVTNAKRDGIGLSNTAERLERLYGGTHRLDLRNASDGGLVVTLLVPFHVDPNPAG